MKARLQKAKKLAEIGNGDNCICSSFEKVKYKKEWEESGEVHEESDQREVDYVCKLKKSWRS